MIISFATGDAITVFWVSFHDSFLAAVVNDDLVAKHKQIIAKLKNMYGYMGLC